jgi:hypothetical protein
MVSSEIPDKDGISALGVLAELVQLLYRGDQTLMGYLDSLYQRYEISQYSKVLSLLSKIL